MTPGREYRVIQWVLYLWTGSWLVLLLCLLSVWPDSGLFRVWIEKLVIAFFGVVVGTMAMRGRLRWQPWVCGPAVLFLALHVLLASLVWLTTSENSEGFWGSLVAHVTVRPYVVASFILQGNLIGGSRFAFEQILMPVIQIAILGFSVWWWRTPPSNHAFESGPPSAAAQRER
jgi:hypothetical protein